MKPTEAKKALSFEKGDPVYFIDGAGNITHGKYDSVHLVKGQCTVEELFGHLVWINLTGVNAPVLCFVRHKALKRGQCNDMRAAT